MIIVALFSPLTLMAADLPRAVEPLPAPYMQGRRGGGGASAGGRQVRGSSHTNISPPNRGGGAGRNTNVNRGGNRNTNVNRNVNVNNNVNVNRNVNVHGGGYYGGGCYGCGWDDHDFARGAAVGLATGAVVGAAVASSNNTTTVVVSPGSVVTALPSGCAATVVGSVTYQRCGSVWYQPQFSGSNVQYIVVSQP
jgi:hypothetical protein